MASAAAVASSSRLALLNCIPVRSATIVWKFSSDSNLGARGTDSQWVTSTTQCQQSVVGCHERPSLRVLGSTSLAQFQKQPQGFELGNESSRASFPHALRERTTSEAILWDKAT